uniref:ATP synthase complex subunit 8 n=1 Tax=Otiorhynchus rugosostriatus TaxID=703598 RepID=J9PGW1_9CUCU|nr:ATP synthase F0 subunit 8 [Otiorhynchus rugosostriatus]
MPQMAPINWLTLYILFSMIFLISVTFFYYLFLYKPKSLMMSKKKSDLNWKW